MKLAILAFGVLFCFSAVPVLAEDAVPKDSGIWGSCKTPGAPGPNEVCKNTTEATDVVKNIINTFLYAIGILSVILIIHSGFKYITSGGNPEGIKGAKSTLTYAVVGLIVAMLAFTIVNFVVDKFKSDPPATTTTTTKAADQAADREGVIG